MSRATPTALASSTARMCGESRVENGIYLCLRPGATPVESYLVDYPELLPAGLTVQKRGVQLFERHGVHHVIDWIGETHYPDPACFIEEVRALGLSRRVALDTQALRKLSRQSLLFAVHAKGYVHDWPKFRTMPAAKHAMGIWPDADWICPIPRNEHHPCEARDGVDPPCSGIWWQNSYWSDPNPTQALADHVLWTHGVRGFRVTLPCGHAYDARRRPYGVNPTYSPAFIARFPITHLEVVHSRDGAHNLTMQQLQGLDLPSFDHPR